MSQYLKYPNLKYPFNLDKIINDENFYEIIKECLKKKEDTGYWIARYRQ